MKKKDDIPSKNNAEYIDVRNDLKQLKVLIIEDHSLMRFAIKQVFSKLSNSQQQYKFVIDIASNCKEAYDKISLRNNFYELILLDIQLPAYPSQKLFSGEDIGLWVKKTLCLSSKIIVITLIKDNFRIQNIIKTVNPDGFFVKGDITPEALLIALKKIFEPTSTTYYSESITAYSQKLISSDFSIDLIDRQLLYEISQGASNVELQELLSLSKSTVQKRKGRLMDIFNVSDNSNRELIIKAKEQGFL
ncbi:response regulator [uncultured Dokdonia sp.]|uniref:response regulator n=1 Tax=uncultured Dokdonia sp. TaxID=575653 RepID=UPI002619ACF6|nr:response regulator [uncultured Dokdonia sp.]